MNLVRNWLCLFLLFNNPSVFEASHASSEKDSRFRVRTLCIPLSNPHPMTFEDSGTFSTDFSGVLDHTPDTSLSGSTHLVAEMLGHGPSYDSEGRRGMCKGGAGPVFRDCTGRRFERKSNKHVHFGSYSVTHRSKGLISASKAQILF